MVVSGVQQDLRKRLDTLQEKSGNHPKELFGACKGAFLSDAAGGELIRARAGWAEAETKIGRPLLLKTL